MDIGKKIKEARLAKGYTQEELGNIVGVQKSAIAKYENGRVVNIKRSILQKLAIALDLKGSDLITEKPTDADDGLSEDIKKLVDFARHSVPENKAAMALKVIQSIVEAD